MFSRTMVLNEIIRYSYELNDEYLNRFVSTTRFAGRKLDPKPALDLSPSSEVTTPVEIQSGLSCVIFPGSELQSNITAAAQ